MEKHEKFKMKPVKRSAIKNRKIIRALTIPLTVGSLASCFPIVGVVVYQKMVDQTFFVIDTFTQSGISGLQLALYDGDRLLGQYLSDENGRAFFSYNWGSPNGVVELRITDVDGELNNLYAERSLEIDINEETRTIELTPIQN